MRRLILFILFPTVMCVCCFGKDKFESPNHQLRAEVNGQSLTVYYKNKLMVTRIHLGVMTDQGNLDYDMMMRDATARMAVKVYWRMGTDKKQ